MDSYLERLQQAIASATHDVSQRGIDPPSGRLSEWHVVYGGSTRASLPDLHGDSERPGAVFTGRKTAGHSDQPEAASAHLSGDWAELFSTRSKVTGTRSSQGYVSGQSSGRNRTSDRHHGSLACRMRITLWSRNQSDGPSHPRTAHRTAMAKISLGARAAPCETNLEVTTSLASITGAPLLASFLREGGRSESGITLWYLMSSHYATRALFLELITTETEKPHFSQREMGHPFRSDSVPSSRISQLTRGPRPVRLTSCPVPSDRPTPSWHRRRLFASGRSAVCTGRLPCPMNPGCADVAGVGVERGGAQAIFALGHIQFTRKQVDLGLLIGNLLLPLVVRFCRVGAVRLLGSVLRLGIGRGSGRRVFQSSRRQCQRWSRDWRLPESLRGISLRR